MTRRRGARFFCFLWLAACGGSTKPPLPDNLAGFEPAVRSAIETAHRSGDVALYCRTLHAHELFAAAAGCYARTKENYLRAMALAAKGDHAAAIAILKAAGTADPVRLQLAESLLATGNAAEAREVFRALTHLPQGHYGLGRTSEGAAAITSLREALRMFPRYGAAQFALAAAYRKAGDAKAAEAALLGYAANQLNAPPIVDPEMAAVTDLNVSSVGLLRKAQQAERANQLDEALRLCEQAVRADAKLTQGWVNLQSLYGRLGRAAEAQQAFERAVQLDPRRGDVHYNLGVLRFGQQRFTEARDAFLKAAELDPNSASAWYNLAVLAAQERHMPKAVEYFRRAYRADPAHADTLAAFGKLGLKP
jgi:tetratricopeptide (TPR) repeat protein